MNLYTLLAKWAARFDLDVQEMEALIPLEYMEMETLTRNICREVLTLMTGYMGSSKLTVPSEEIVQMRAEIWAMQGELHTRHVIPNPDGTKTMISQLKLL